jgi:putative ABC transport system permease protein
MFRKFALQWKIMSISLRRSGSRSVLAISAVALGIGAMMIMLALSDGAARELEEVNDQMGRNLFVIAAARMMSTPGRGQGWYVSDRLRESDALLLRLETDGIRAIAPIREGSVRAEFEREAITTTVRGTTPDFFELRNFRLADGRFIDSADGAEMRRVAVIGSFVANELDDGMSMVGETIRLGGVPFEVVGQLEEKGIGSGQNEDDQIVVPLETLRRRLFNSESLSRLLVQVEDPAAMAFVQRRARELLRESHRLDPEVRDDFEITTQIQGNEIRRRSNAFVQGLSRLFAAMTLAIGGAGVLGVTFLNVKDRIPEIGLRMAVGARRRDITSLFVAEACLLGVLGGIAGIATGLAAVFALRAVLEWNMTIGIRGVALPFATAVALAIAFGVAPAMRAASIIPVEALRDR